MTEKEINSFIKTIRKQKKRITADSKLSKKFLIDLGIFSEKGRVTKAYKGICIPNEQD